MLSKYKGLQTEFSDIGYPNFILRHGNTNPLTSILSTEVTPNFISKPKFVAELKISQKETDTDEGTPFILDLFSMVWRFQRWD